MSRALVLLSGGIDSAAALAWCHRKYSEVDAITFEYHLRPFRERLSVLRLLQYYPGKLIEVPVQFLRETADQENSRKMEVPEGYIANRNLIFYSIAAYYADLHQCDSIVGGHICIDAEAFPDSSPVFFERLQQLINDALLTHKVRIELPFSTLTKIEVLQKAYEWNVPLQHTWSCYWDQSSPCGECISCKERAEAFNSLTLQDPLHQA
jgi:7-cyano-7-deazaguanine synthase